jgi:TatA/E family protein of Tat protein translocase
MLAFINDTGMIVVVLAVVVLFGASRLPKLARNLGEAGREFRKAHDEANTPDTLPAPVAPVATVGIAEPVVASRVADPDLIVARAAATQVPDRP